MKFSRVLRAIRRVYGSAGRDMSQQQAAETAQATGYPLLLTGDVWSKLEREARETTFERARIILRAFALDIKFVDLEGNDVEAALEGVLGTIEEEEL